MTKKEDPILKTGRNVLQIESDAIKALSLELDQSFSRAVQMLSECDSRVIVTGMGKSGLVGRKIASTLASCGTPALFIHAAEAGHGDLGMIVDKDVVLAISYSGETLELISLLDHIKRLGVKLISITGDRKSKLGEYSDIVLEAKVEKEAEPSGLVPTASSTVALALGDAMAVALMNQKGFSKDDFAFVHPRGNIGKRLVKVSALMHRGGEIPCVAEDTPMASILEEMTEKKMGMTCVLDEDGRLLGIITDGDLRRLMQQYGEILIRKTAKECMTANPLTIERGDLAVEALKLMEENKITSLIIKNKAGQIEGIIHLHDLWRTEMF